MRLRLLATALLSHGEDLLLLHRGQDRRFFPGMWAEVGGHIEPDELGDVRGACLREIAEETGLTEKSIVALKLRYLLLRRTPAEIVQHYMYVGRSLTRDLADCDEGTLHWVPRAVALDRPMSFVVRAALEHFLQVGDGGDTIWVGSTGLRDGAADFSWTALRDHEGVAETPAG